MRENEIIVSLFVSYTKYDDIMCETFTVCQYRYEAPEGA